VRIALQGKYGSDIGKVSLFRLTLQGRLLQGRIAYLGYPIAEPGRELYSGWPAEDVSAAPVQCYQYVNTALRLFERVLPVLGQWISQSTLTVAG
jgi:hypothetical protein